MYVVTAGLDGLDPMPRNRALLTLRAVNSVNMVFGAKMPASVTFSAPGITRWSSAVTGVMLAGTVFRSAASRSAVTMTGGRITLGD